MARQALPAAADVFRVRYACLFLIVSSQNVKAFKLAIVIPGTTQPGRATGTLGGLLLIAVAVYSAWGPAGSHLGVAAFHASFNYT